MNKNGFTTVEMVLTMVLVIIIMLTITNVTFTYRDKSDYEEKISEITTYKNTLTKTIYDDILTSDVVSLNEIEEDYKYELITTKTPIYLTIIYENRANNQITGIEYNGVFYKIPSDEKIEITTIDFQSDDINSIYTLDINFQVQNLDKYFKIHFVIS